MRTTLCYRVTIHEADVDEGEVLDASIRGFLQIRKQRFGARRRSAGGLAHSWSKPYGRDFLDDGRASADGATSSAAKRAPENALSMPIAGGWNLCLPTCEAIVLARRDALQGGIRSAWACRRTLKLDVDLFADKPLFAFQTIDQVVCLAPTKACEIAHSAMR